MSARTAEAIAFELARDSGVLAGATRSLHRDVADRSLDAATLAEQAAGAQAVAEQAARLARELAEAVQPEPGWMPPVPAGLTLPWTSHDCGYKLNYGGALAYVMPEDHGADEPWVWWAHYGNRNSGRKCGFSEALPALIAVEHWLRQHDAPNGGAT